MRWEYEREVLDPLSIEVQYRRAAGVPKYMAYVSRCAKSTEDEGEGHTLIVGPQDTNIEGCNASIVGRLTDKRRSADNIGRLCDVG